MIYDGGSSASAPLFISSPSLCSVNDPFYSNSVSPVYLFPSTNLAYVKFTSDGTGFNGDGYEIIYSCGSVVSAAESITGYDSGGAGGNYNNNEYLWTRITCPPSRSLTLKFTELDIDGSMPSCSTDRISIYDASSRNVFCGTLTGSALPQIHVPGGTANVAFISDSTITRAGYSVNYECSLPTSGNNYI